MPALVGLVAGAVLAAAFEPKIVALLRRISGKRADDSVPVRDVPADGRRRRWGWLIALATAIASVLAVVTVIDSARGRSLVGDRNKTFLPTPSKPVKVAHVAVPAVVNLPFADAEARLETAGFEVDREEEYSATVEPERVIPTEPAAETRVEKGSSVAVLVSGNDAIVPEVAGLTYDDAEGQLEDAGFTVDQQEEVKAATLVGTVIRTDPAAGTRAEEGSSVRVFVSATGVIVPDVTGLLLSDARNKVGAAGLVAGSTISATEPMVSVGSVIRTDPPAGTTVREGHRRHLRRLVS